MTRPIVIYGVGGFAREVLALLRDINAARFEWDVLGFVDDDAASWGRTLNDLPVLGGRDWLHDAAPRPHVAFGIGSPAAKARLSDAVRGASAGFPKLVHPSAVISKRVELGDGVVITAGNILTTEIRIHDFAMLNLMCTVGHDCDVGRFVTVSPGVNVSGNVTIGEGCDIGTGAAIVQGVAIGEWTIVGAGAVIARDLPANCTAVGVPAKPIKVREPGWQLQVP